MAAGARTQLVGQTMADAAAAVPLRAHSVVVGALVVAEPRGGVFHANDIRLLSTIATHAAVVLANARFFEMVRRAKEQWETAFDALSEGMAVVDQEGRVRRANRALAAMLGRPVIDVVGQDLCHALGQSPALQELLEATGRGERPSPLVARSSRPGRTMRVAAARMPNPTAEQSLVVLVEDVTDQQTMESQLLQSEKLAAVGHLVSGVAHELNNPLTSIAGLAEFLLEQHELGPNDRGHLRVIHEQAERAGRIVRNLLTFARKSTTERAPVDLNDVVRRTLTLLSYDLRLEDVETRQELAHALPEILGDRPALQQVVLNLLTNAGHAVAGNAAGRPRLIEVRTWFDGQVHLRVSDNGPGIPDEAVSQLFTPFFTTKEPGQGTGLGLSISYSIVQAHGGQIVLERPAEGGAAPAPPPPPPPDSHPAPPPSAEPLAQRAPPPEIPASPRRILLVDDDPAVRRVVRALFGREGHTVEVARNTQQALELAASNTYDLIIADGHATARGRASSGGGGGRKLFVEELVARKAGLRGRILVATGDVQPATEEALGRLGLRYVRKPFNLRDLRDEAARVWAATTLS